MAHSSESQSAESMSSESSEPSGAESDPSDPGARAGVRLVTIDGPAGCGKSTVVRLLSERLDGLSFSSGLVYRAVTWLALEKGIDPADTAAVERALEAATIAVVETDGALRVEVDGHDPGAELHGSRVTEAIHWIADDTGLRRALLPLQRRLPVGRVILAEGRDLGTVVFPDAPVKVFLTATLEERARRRHAEFRDRLGEDVSLEEVTERIRRRDQNDSDRASAPLRAAPDARVIDTTDRSPDQVVGAILEGIPDEWLPRGQKSRP